MLGLGYTEVGVDLGASKIKLTVLRDGILEAYEIIDVDLPKYSEEYFEFFRDALVNFKKENKYKRVSLNVSISVDNRDVFVDFLKVPFIDKKSLKSSVKLEIDTLFNERKDVEVYSNWEVLGEPSGENPEVQVLVGSIKKNIVNSLSRFKTISSRVNKVNLKPVFAESLISKSSSAFIDVGSENTVVSMYSEGSLKDIEIINQGEEDFVNLLMEYIKEKELNIDPYDLMTEITVFEKEVVESESSLSLNEEDWYGDILGNDFVMSEEESSASQDDSERAEEDIEDEGDYQEKEDEIVLSEIAELSEEFFDDLIEKIKVAIRMFELENSTSIEEIIYTGEFFSVDGFTEELSRELEEELSRMEKLALESESSLEENLGNSIVAASSQKRKDEIDFGKSVRANVDYSSLVTMMLALSLSTGIGVYLAGGDYDDRLNEINEKVLVQDEYINDISAHLYMLEESSEEKRAFLKKAEGISNSKKWLSDFLYVLPEVTPITVSFKEVDIKEGIVVLSGESTDYKSIGMMIDRLDDLGVVSLDNIEKRDSSSSYAVKAENIGQFGEEYKLTHVFTISVSREDRFLSEES